MEVFQVTLIVATLLCTLVAGFEYAFAVVVIPGIRTLGDGEFLRAFQVMDRVIQNRQPVFMLVWIDFRRQAAGDGADRDPSQSDRIQEISASRPSSGRVSWKRPGLPSPFPSFSPAAWPP